MAVKFLDLYGQYLKIQNDIDVAISRVLKNTSFIGGEEVEAFEAEFGEWIGSHCVACANGTDALEILLEAMGIGHGDEVLVPALTWISTAEAVTRVGAVPVFVDVLPQYYTLNPDQARKKICSKTKGIIPVHLYGLPANMNELMSLAEEFDLKVIEDCAQAHGATYEGKNVGTIGHAAAFSFYPGKNLGAYGDAGAMVTANESLAKQARMIARHGQLQKHDHQLEGRNSRLDGIQAAILRAKLPYLCQWIKARRNVAKQYEYRLELLDFTLPKIPQNSSHAFHLYVIQCADRDALKMHLDSAGIQTGIHYPKALPFTKIYQERFHHSPNDFPVAYGLQSQILSLPMGDHITIQSIEEVSNAIKRFYS
jgi:dTDP-4-amino-4,6-dideoxygalactose transaminase